MIKEVNILLAERMADKVHLRKIVKDSEGENLILDAIQTVDGEDEVYYTDISLRLDELPFDLTEQEIESLR